MNRDRGRAAVAAERRNLAFSLRKAGVSYRDIGAQLRVSHTQVRRDVDAVIGDLVAASRTNAAGYRVMQLAQVDEVILALWPGRANPEVARTLLAAFQRQARLLGIDAPTQIESTDNAVYLAQQERLIAALAEASRESDGPAG